MRKDLHQVIVDEPRHGSGTYSQLYKGVRRAKRLKLDADYELLNDDFGRHVSMVAKRFRKEYKTFGDHTMPLYRCLEKQVGRKWDEVYAELSQMYDRRSVVKAHVHQHIFDKVEVNVYIHEGQAYRHGGRRWWFSRTPIGVNELYVDPRDGILRRGTYDWQLARRELDAKREVELRKTHREFGEVKFRLEATGESHRKYDGRTLSWFKYSWIDVVRTREVPQYEEQPIFYKDKWIHLPVLDEDGKQVFVREQHLERVEVRTNATKKDIRDYGLNK